MKASRFGVVEESRTGVARSTEGTLRRAVKREESNRRHIFSRGRRRKRYPFQTYLPQGQGTVSTGFFFSKGLRQTGQFFCHIITPEFLPRTSLKPREFGAGHLGRGYQISGLSWHQGPWGLRRPAE